MKQNESIKRISDNVLDEIGENTKRLNVEMKSILERISKNEDIRKLRDISNKIWKEQNIKGKKISFVTFKKITSS